MKNYKTRITFFTIFIVVNVTFVSAKKWKLEECINYALTHNTNIKKAYLKQKSSREDIKQAKAALFPSLMASANYMVNYQPWTEAGRATVANGYVQSTIKKTFYNGNYGINSNWIIWNGNKNHNQLKATKLVLEELQLDSLSTVNDLQEKIAQLYFQILYAKEAINANKVSLEASKTNEQRGKELLKNGKLSKVELAQLIAQRAQDEYNVIEAKSNARNYKRQLKEILQITNEEEFEVEIPSTTEIMAEAEIPNIGKIYQSALNSRPEIKKALVDIEYEKINTKIANALKFPTISLNAGIGTNNTSMSQKQWGKQIKTNIDASAGISISVPILDNRNKRTSKNKALIEEKLKEVELESQKTLLYSTIENYWINAQTNQSKFKSAKLSVESAQESYNLLSEQFKLGIKNITELTNGKIALIQAEQNKLQSKYLTLLNINLLYFYMTGTMLQ